MTQYYTDYHPVPNYNYIINGNFNIWQRGTSQTSLGYGSDDRWYNYHSTSTKTASRQSFTLGQTDVPNNPTYFSRTVVVTGGTSSSSTSKVQRIETVKLLSNKTLTISFWAKADASRHMAVTYTQYFGTGGSPSSSVLQLIEKVALTTSWQKFILTFDLPSVSGKTLGTAGNDYLQISFIFDAGSDFDSYTGSLGNQSGTFDIAQVKVEEGSIATPFVNRPLTQEIALCQRYYSKSYELSDAPGTITNRGTIYAEEVVATYTLHNLIAFFKVTMRAVPSIITYGRLTGVANTATDENAATDIVLSGLSGIGQTGWSALTATTAFSDDGSGTVRGSCQWTADAEL